MKREYLNKEEFDFLGITKFHAAGYTGKHITIASKESILNNVFDDVECDDYFGGASDHAKHGTRVMDYIRQVAPDARKIATDMSGRIDAKGWHCEGFEKLLANPPQIFTGSIWGTSDYKDVCMDKYKELRDKGCLMVFGAGNSDSKGTLKIVENDVFKAIAAYKLVKGKPKKEFFSSIGEAVDFASFDNLKATWDKRRHTGTSFAAPVFASMAGLVQDFFIANTGKQLPLDMLLQFIEDNCIDVETKGKDTSSGFGLFILPDPATIDIARYTDAKVNKLATADIVLTIDSDVALVNGKEVKLDVPAKIENNRTLVPIRFVAEALNCEVIWDEETRKVGIKKKG